MKKDMRSLIEIINIHYTKTDVVIDVKTGRFDLSIYMLNGFDIHSFRYIKNTKTQEIFQTRKYMDFVRKFTNVKKFMEIVMPMIKECLIDWKYPYKVVTQDELMQYALDSLSINNYKSSKIQLQTEGIIDPNLNFNIIVLGDRVESKAKCSSTILLDRDTSSEKKIQEIVISHIPRMIESWLYNIRGNYDYSFLTE